MKLRTIFHQLKSLRSGTGGGPELGAVSLTSAIMISGMLIGGVAAVQHVVVNKQSMEAKAIGRYYLETANETAISLTSQLLGNSTVIPYSGGFTLNSRGVGKASSNWTIRSGRLEIPSCLRASRSVADNTLYTDNNDNSQLGACDAASSATTTISVQQLKNLAFDSVKSGDTDRYVVVDATTRLGRQSISKNARLRLAETTKVCNVDDPSNKYACNVDHCKFMKPLRDQSENAMYKLNGNVEIEVNEKYSERLRLTTNPAQLAIQKLSESDPAAQNLYNFYDDAYKNGRINPFDNWQSIKPSVSSQDYIKIEPDGSVWLDVKNSVDSNTGAKGSAIFDGFLRYHEDSELSYAEPWPKGETYSQNAANFKAGCQRTVGTSDPDLCARINVDIQSTQYKYDQRRMCYYDGPLDFPSSLKEGLRSWTGSSSKTFQTFSSWETTKDTNVGERVTQDNRSLWKDDAPHHDFGPAPSYTLHQYYPHRLDNVKVGTLETREVKSTSVSAPNDCGSATSSKTCESKSYCEWKKTGTSTQEVDVYDCVKTSDTTTQYYARAKTYNWSTRCEYRKPAKSDFKSADLTVCFYLAYYNIEDRNSCQRVPSDYVCRNMNGCFVEGTKILMADGSEKNIETVKMGELVYNPSTKKAGMVSKVVVGEEAHDLYEIQFGKGSVTATYNHPFVSKSGMTTAEHLRVGDLIVDKDLKNQKITKITKIPPPKGTQVWNLMIINADGTESTDFDQHTFVANGLTSGDYFIQQSSSYMKDQNQRFSEFLKSQESKQ